MSTEIAWRCLGNSPHVAPCGAEGTGDDGAEAHVQSTGHATVTGIHPHVLAAAVAKAAADCEAVTGS